CGAECPHESWAGGRCAVCAMPCDHPGHDAETLVCSRCGAIVPHAYVKGVCALCGGKPEFYDERLPRELFKPMENKGEVHILSYETDAYTPTTAKEPVVLKKEMCVYVPYGYDQAEKNKNPDDIIGTIPVDSIFSPVVRVNFNVEDTRVGNEMDFDKLTLEVWTNGTLRPEEAVAKAAGIMIAHMKLFLNMDGVGPEPAPEPEKEKVEIEPVDEANFTLDKTTIEDLDLSVRSFNCLKRAGINTMADLVDKTEDEMMKVRNLGRKSLEEVKKKMEDFGVSFKPGSTPIEE
ncbi:MAG: hypothetical protein IKP64_02190, partial [Selenomonadaceae bacterium]|nr:hypothetical protein [Selenomonadaceae bacterium]